MEVLVTYENGFRFSAVCKGHTVTTGRGDDGNDRRDGMWPAQLFAASIGMCIGGYVAKFCKEQGIPCDDMTIELSRRIETASSGTTPSALYLNRSVFPARTLVGLKDRTYRLSHNFGGRFPVCPKLDGGGWGGLEPGTYGNSPSDPGSGSSGAIVPAERETEA